MTIPGTEGASGTPDHSGTSEGTQGTSADSQNTEGQGSDTGTGDRIPLSRFNQVIAQRNELKADNERLRLAITGGTPANGEADAGFNAPEGDPPADATVAQKLDHYMTQTLGKRGPEMVEAVLKKQLGVSTEQLGQLVASMGAEVKTQAVSRFEAACKTHNIDPSSQDVRLMAAGILNADKDCTPEAAVARIAKATGSQSQGGSPARDTSTAELVLQGLSGVSEADVPTPETFGEAAALAHDGKAIRQRSALDILSESGKRA